jgi:hypothetical protein
MFQGMIQLCLVVALALFPAPMLPHPCHFNPLCSCSFHPTKVGFRNLIKILFEVLILYLEYRYCLCYPVIPEQRLTVCMECINK